MATRIPPTHLDAWRALLNAHASVVAHVEQALDSAGLPPLAWYDVLWALRRAPGRRARMSVLADGLTVSRGGLTKLAGRLEAAGLLRREPAPDDRRGSYAVLTDDGERMLRAMWPVYSRVLDEAFVSVLDETQARAIATGLRRVSDTPPN
jgi:DNA-binding MarR family transcriptional regulator